MAACPSCSRDVTAGFAFCPHCGAAMSSGGRTIEERKLVTVLFADVMGSTQMAEALDAEEVRDLMAAYFGLAREEIESRGGTVEKFIGDAVMAVFGVPVAHDDDPARALRAALAIRGRLAVLSDRLRGEGRPELQVRIGVNSGEVVASVSPRPGDVMVTGDAVNVASRLQQIAEPGQILVGARTASAAAGFRFRDLGPVGLRGKEIGVVVNELVDAANGQPRAATALRAPLVGRQEELTLLTSLYDRVVADRQPHLVTLYGQPGVGKSRLTQEFLGALAQRPEPPRIVRGRCLSYGSGVTFWPLAEILKDQAEILDNDAPGVAVAKLQAYGRRLLSPEVDPDPARTIALLGFTVGIEVPGRDFGRLDPEELRGEMVAAWRSFFSAIATEAPVVAVIEDIHWAEAALLDMLDELGARVQGAVLFLCPARPDLTDRRPGWGGGRRSFSSVFLDPLGPNDASRLVTLLLDVEELPPDLHARIVDRAGGNPFFAEEILRHLIDQGHISRADDRWRAEPGVTAVAIPDTVQAVLAARIDLLGADEKRALQSAAVVGRLFWPTPVARYLDASPTRIGELLRSLEARDLVISRLGSSIAGESEFIFKHALVRDVAYESIPKRDRAMAHLEVARWIEEAIGERRLEMVELLAHHYTEAQRSASWGRVEPDRREQIRTRAVELLFDAAEEAGRRFAMDRARERIVTGLELARGPLERARGLEASAQVTLWRDDGNGAWASAKEAIDLRVVAGPSTAADRLAIARLCGKLLSIPTRWPGLMQTLPTRDEAQPYLDLGFEMLADGDSVERVGLLLARAGWGWGFGEADADPGRAEHYNAAADEAVALARRLGDDALLSAALDTAGASSQETGGYGAAQPFQEERMGLVSRLDDPAEIGDIFFTNAWNLTHIGEYRRAASLFDDYVRHVGDRRGPGPQAPATVLRVQAASRFVFHAVAFYRLGEWDRFWEIFHEIDGHVDRNAIPYHISRLHALAAYVHDVAGEPEEADRLIGIVDRSQAIRGAAGVSGPRSWIVQVLVRRGRFADARRRLAVADPAREGQNRDLTLEARADLVAAEGTWDEAASVVGEARAWAGKTGLRALPAFADRLDGLAAVASGEVERGFALINAAGESFAQLEAAWELARTQLALAEALHAAGRGEDAALKASDALATLETLTAPTETERARSLAG